MTTVLNARPKGFVNTPTIDRITRRAFRYLQSGFSIHLRGPAGTGKTTLAMHLANLMDRPIMLLYGDDDFSSSDLIGSNKGYTRRKVVDNYIHNVLKHEDELQQKWVDSRLTMACREGFTLVYDEFNRSPPEVNNVLLSALEERLLVLPPESNRSEYIRVSPHFRAIFTSNPEEYWGIHGTQDALLDRVITINVPEPDLDTQQKILVEKIGVDAKDAGLVVNLVNSFRDRAGMENSSGLRSCIMIGQVCHEHEIPIKTSNEDFQDICDDVLTSRSPLSRQDAMNLLSQLFQEYESDLVVDEELAVEQPEEPNNNVPSVVMTNVSDESAAVPNWVLNSSLGSTPDN